ncbi:MAG TPA: transferrin-binding protein-like solute binding protein [Burkholderiales bacterium]|nr:transferrin-binding protein-like solute binding protein [Burkholderiales bacterium]
MASVARATAFWIIAASLAACGTGGGGGGGGGTPTQIPPAPGQPPAPDQTTQRQNTPPDNTPRTDVAFTSFSAVQPNQNVIMSGSATTISGTRTANGPVTSVSPETNGASNLTLGFDSQRQLTALAISAPEGNVSFDRSAGHSISCSGGGICQASSSTASAITGDALGSGWNYQTYGVWAVQSGPNNFVLGGVSAGNATPGNAVPTTGTARFFGNASGYFIDTAGIRSTTSAAMIANVDFQNRAIGFTTIDTTLLNPNQGPGTSRQELDLSGSLSWAAGVNNFSGQVQTRDRTLNGSASGKFYGPTAEEIGGTYQLGGAGVSRLVGGFGGIKR